MGDDTFCSFILSIAALASESLRPASEPSKLYDSSNSWKPLLGPRHSFLEIFDIPISPGGPARLLLKVTDDINGGNASIDLPPQEIHTIRVYFMENISVHRDRSLIETTSFAGSPAMMSQWGSSPPKIHWETHSYKLSLAPTLKTETRVENTDSPYIDSISVVAGTIRRTLRCMVVSTDNGRIICKCITTI